MYNFNNNHISNANDVDFLLDNNFIYRNFYKQKHKAVKHSTSKTKELRLNAINTARKISTFSIVMLALCFIGFTFGAVNSLGKFTGGFPIGVLLPFFLNIPCMLLRVISAQFLSVSRFILSDSEKEELNNNDYNYTKTTRLIKCEYCKSKIFEDSKTCDVCGARL